MVDLLIWLVLFTPLFTALFICLFLMKLPKAASAIATMGILISFFSSVFLFWYFSKNSSLLPLEHAYPWIELVGLRVDFGFLIDRISLLMLLIVTGVGSCIFFYSIGYMQGDKSFPRYFASLSFFVFSMIGIVLANNFLMLFVFWELVAVSSYLLIGFWFEKPAAADAGNKAFIVNRVADFGFVVGIFYVWMLSGLGGSERTFNFTALSSFVPQALSQGILTPPMLAIATLLIFCGVIGKSAQFPLYIWLPDAMEGPTPVSALIHAATMVAAGVYLLARTFFIVGAVSESLQVIAAVGAATALLAALLAVVQNDIKKILAYSTISQLGYMVLAVGLGSREGALFHLTTHAFFKALLFLGAGAMIHALHTQDIWEMGGLIKKMPLVAITFLIGTLALCGIPPFSGFFSKDEILAVAFSSNRLLYSAALLTAFLTAFYMSRACWIAVLGHGRINKHGSGHGHTHETPLVMKIPLLVLAFFSSIAGFLGLPEFILGHAEQGAHFNWLIAAVSSATAVSGLALGWIIYGNVPVKEDPLKKQLGEFYCFLVKKYYLDEIFLTLAKFFDDTLAKILAWFDWNVLIQKGVNGIAQGTARSASFIRRAQTGRLQTYAMVFGFGVVALVYFTVMRPH